MEIIAVRECLTCGKIIEIKPTLVEKHVEKTLPWFMFHTQLYELPYLSCCDDRDRATHVRIMSEIYDGFASKRGFQIGSEDVPVIIDEPSTYAVTRSFVLQVEIQKQLEKQNKLLQRESETFYEKMYTYFSLHFEQIIDEMDHQEVLDILRTVEAQYEKKFVYKGKNEKKLITKWIRKEIKALAHEESDEIKKYFFFLIVEYFVQLKLIPQIHYLRWDVQKFEKMLGESLLMYLLVSFPLTGYFSYLKDEAILRLTNKGHFQKQLRQLLEKTQTDLEKSRTHAQNLQVVVESQRTEIADLQVKNERLRLKYEELEQRRHQTDQGALVAKQSQKIQELKGLIRELQQQVKHKVNDEQQPMEQVEVVTTPLEIVENDKSDLSLLKGKTVAIFGDLSYQVDMEKLPCRVVTVDSLRNPHALAVLKQSDILVVLTQHISHSCMWSIKEYAIAHQIPIFYSRHTNLDIILGNIALKLEQD